MLSLTLLLLAAAPAVPVAERCEVEIVGIPAAALKNHWVKIGTTQTHALDDRVLHITPGPDPIRLKVGGPRYQGELVVTTATCEAYGVELVARPRPVILRFKCAPDDLVVRCLSCRQPTRRYLAADSPSIPLHDAQGGVAELELKARGFKTRRRRVALLPGDNELRVKLEPLAR